MTICPGLRLVSTQHSADSTAFISEAPRTGRYRDCRPAYRQALAPRALEEDLLSSLKINIYENTVQRWPFWADSARIQHSRPRDPLRSGKRPFVGGHSCGPRCPPRFGGIPFTHIWNLLRFYSVPLICFKRLFLVHVSIFLLSFSR